MNSSGLEDSFTPESFGWKIHDNKWVSSRAAEWEILKEGLNRYVHMTEKRMGVLKDYFISGAVNDGVQESSGHFYLCSFFKLALCPSSDKEILEKYGLLLFGPEKSRLTKKDFDSHYKTYRDRPPGLRRIDLVESFFALYTFALEAKATSFNSTLLSDKANKIHSILTSLQGPDGEIYLGEENPIKENERIRVTSGLITHAVAYWLCEDDYFKGSLLPIYIEEKWLNTTLSLEDSSSRLNGNPFAPAPNSLLLSFQKIFQQCVNNYKQDVCVDRQPTIDLIVDTLNNADMAKKLKIIWSNALKNASEKGLEEISKMLKVDKRVGI